MAAAVLAPAGGVALRLMAHASSRTPDRDLVFIAASAARAEQICAILFALCPERPALLLPAWDNLPYDLVGPSPANQGLRMRTLMQWRIGDRAPLTLVASPASLLQKVPSARVLDRGPLRFSRSDRVRRERLEAQLASLGYWIDDRVDEPGEAAIHGETFEIYPPGEPCPFRFSLADGVIREIRIYDPATQRSLKEVPEVAIWPVTEAPRSSRSAKSQTQERNAASPGQPQGGDRRSVLEFIDKAVVLAEEGLSEELAATERAFKEAYALRRRFPVADIAPPPPARLLARASSTLGTLEALGASALDVAGLARPFGADEAGDGLEWLRCVAPDFLAGGGRLILGGDALPSRRLARNVGARLGVPVERFETAAVALLNTAGVSVTALGLDEPVIDEVARIALVPLRMVAREAGASGAPDLLQAQADQPLPGDLVVHESFGLGRLDGLEILELDGVSREALRIAYKDGDSILIPVEDLGRLWRYAGDEAGVGLDRLRGESWRARRQAIEADLEITAMSLAEASRLRVEAIAPALSPPEGLYRRFCTGFAHAETPDQLAAMADIERDLASGRAMNRLVCGDVGFGKTEIALRAAAIAAFSGSQVLVCAPTTVLALQHFRTFCERFAEYDIVIKHISGLVAAAEAASAREGLATGEVAIAIGTHALASDGLHLKAPGLVIIDEEQRFGTGVKARLTEGPVHVLTLSATPIPRTLQAALAGLQDLSVLSTPPLRRLPVRTLVGRCDEVVLAEALLAERRRGGQSLVVVPKIADMDGLVARIDTLAPDLEVVAAHGEMPPAEVAGALIAFSEGKADVLVSTNIVENGLDVPTANTIVVWGAEAFGLAQLHQLRGRVGRGAVQGHAFLLAGSEALGRAARRRLRLLEVNATPGSGALISLEDLDMRGAGDASSERQTGHLRLIGQGLYQRLLERALLRARGEDPGLDEPVQLSLGTGGLIPVAYVPDPAVRLGLYWRLARVADEEALEALVEEIEDRFGKPPPELLVLLDLTRLRALCAGLGVARVEAGPQAIALTLEPGRRLALAEEGGRAGQEAREDGSGRFILPIAIEDPEARIGRVLAVLRGAAAPAGSGSDASAQGGFSRARSSGAAEA